MSHEERLVNIESDLTHLDQLVESLNQTIIGQDKTIQQLQIQMNRLTSDLEAKEMDSIKGTVTKPPHYQ
ncbi:MAG: SlyX family protein [Pedosphaera sp.]|nr:SlyX family protein [Pedosphaera sp.]|tara:strand:- start:21 stop:227 length:207 start_codon:yes stop_codon:yes gene_type:complete